MEATATKIDYWLNTDVCEYYDDEVSLRDYCECNDEPFPEDDDARWKLAEQLRDWDSDDFWINLKHSELNTYCIVTGSLGLWWGKPEIRPAFFNSLEDALHECFDNMDDAQCYVKDGVIHAVGLHHDGRNHYEIYVLKDKFVDRVDHWCAYETGEFPFNLRQISHHVRYLY